MGGIGEDTPKYTIAPQKPSYALTGACPDGLAGFRRELDAARAACAREGSIVPWLRVSDTLDVQRKREQRKERA